MNAPVRVTPEFLEDFKAVAAWMELDADEEKEVKGLIRADFADEKLDGWPHTIHWLALQLRRCTRQWGAFPTMEQLQAAAVELGLQDDPRMRSLGIAALARWLLLEIEFARGRGHPYPQKHQPA